jgi:hypothetical protein
MAHRRRSRQAEHFEILKLGPIADNKIAKPVFCYPFGGSLSLSKLIQGLRTPLRCVPHPWLPSFAPPAHEYRNLVVASSRAVNSVDG